MSETAIVIPCHNYGRFLFEAIASVLAQSQPAAEIVVVDDSSKDNTAEVAAAFSGAGVRYLRIEAGNVNAARRAGFEATTAPIVCFLDADDVLPADYLDAGLPLFEQPNVGIVYSDARAFGAEDSLRTYPPRTGCSLQQRNYCHAGSLVRRAAIELSREAWLWVPASGHDDWWLWRCVDQDGWLTAKSPAVYLYRRHDDNNSTRRKESKSTYRARFLTHRAPVTLAIPLSGRRQIWPRLRDWLDRQTWPREQVRLILMDCSSDPDFGVTVKRYLGGSSWPDARYLRLDVSQPGLADRDRRTDPQAKTDVQLAVARIYRRLMTEVTTEYVQIVEDDVIPPVDAIAKLMSGMDETTAAVSGAVRSRYHQHFIAWHRYGHPITEPGDGIERVLGTGFGCLLLRSSVWREIGISHREPYADFDPNFFYGLSKTNHWQAKINWSVVCDHLHADGTPVQPPELCEVPA